MNRAEVNAKAIVVSSSVTTLPGGLLASTVNRTRLDCCCCLFDSGFAALGRYSTEPDQNSGEKSKTKPLCQLSVRPNPLFMSSGPGKWGRIWECWQACGLWVHESYSMNLLERRIMAPRQAASRPRPACFCWTELPVAGAPSSRDRNGPAPGLLLARPRDR